MAMNEQPKKKHLTITINQSLFERAVAAAEEAGYSSLPAYLRTCIWQLVGEIHEPTTREVAAAFRDALTTALEELEFTYKMKFE